MTVRRLFSLLTLLLLLPHASLRAQLQEVGDGGPGPFKAQHLTVELVSLANGIAPGGTQQVGLVITLEEHWHVYWKNAGDSGEPPSVKWTLPAGLSAGPMQFPIPQRLPLGPLMDFGYEDTAAFPFTLTAVPGTQPGPAHLDARVTWLVCREVCIPGKAHLGLNLNITPGATPGAPVGALGDAIHHLPLPLPARMRATVQGGKTDLVLTLTTGTAEEEAEFYPLEPDIILNAASQKSQTLPDGIRIWIERIPDATQLPSTLRGVVKINDSEAYEIDPPVVVGEVARPVSVSRASTTSSVTALSAIGLALLGGIILNLMPCVFPVLFLKGLALVQSSGSERKSLRSHGLVYTLGILVSFWTIVGILLALRAGGSQSGWGFQLQSPVFVAVLAAFLFFFALSLAGQFDLGLSLTSAGGDLAKKEGYTGSFFTGVLATIVATPCTAPLMGAAIGFALAQPASITFAVFTALGLGLALPYLLLTLQPAWTRWLPRPGAWMETLKQLTAVPLFGTVIWLTWVFGSLYTGAGVDHIARLLFAFLVISIAGWVLGRWPARTWGTITAVLLIACGLAIPLTQSKKSTLNWQPYSQATLDSARALGHPVFIDFTAAWCLSCQVNEKVVLQSADVVHELASRNFTLMRADWTQYDPDITRQLRSIDRSGVPTYVIYPGTPTSAADVLPELLTQSLVLKAIARDSK